VLFLGLRANAKNSDPSRSGTLLISPFSDFFQDGIPLSVPTSAAAAQQNPRKRLWSVPTAEELEAVPSSSGQCEQQQSRPHQEKRTKAEDDSRVSAVDSDRSLSRGATDLAAKDQNANIWTATGGSAAHPTLLHVPQIEEQEEVPLTCPSHYDAEVWDALPRDLQLEIVQEAAPPAQPLPSFSLPHSNNTPVRNSATTAKSSKLSRSKQKSDSKKNTILQYLRKS